MVGFDSIILFFQKKRASLFRTQGRKEIKSIFYSTSATRDAFKKLRFESVKLQQKKYSRLESINSSREFQKYTRSVCVCVNVSAEMENSLLGCHPGNVILPKETEYFFFPIFVVVVVVKTYSVETTFTSMEKSIHIFFFCRLL